MTERQRPTPSQEKASFIRNPILVTKFRINSRQIFRTNGRLDLANKLANLTHVPKAVKARVVDELRVLNKRLDTLHGKNQTLRRALFDRDRTR